MSGFVRLIEDGRLMYWFSRQNIGPRGYLLKGHVEGHPFPVCVPESATMPEPGGPRGTAPRLAFSADAELPCDV